jgi:hypothetical protein
MNDDLYKQYTLQARRCIRGEAFFESLVCNYCLPHHIVGAKDIGIDYICEWVYGDKPTGILFAVQIKSFRAGRKNSPKFIRTDQVRNGLCEYSIHNSNLKINQKTLNYWRVLGIPSYLFAVVEKSDDNGEVILDCYYKRFTEFITNEDAQNNFDPYEPFYKVNNHSSFIAFKNHDEGTLGFARDLFIDHVHWSYYKGAITCLDPRTIGLRQFSEDYIFVDMLKSYKDKVIPTFHKTRQNLERLVYLDEKNSGSNDIYKLLDNAPQGTSLFDSPPEGFDE